MDNYNYPMGSDTPDAPWNEHEKKEVEVNMYMRQTLKKEGITCYTTDYSSEEDGYSFYDTDWERVAIDNNISTPLEIINEFGKLLDKLAKNQMFGNKYISYWKEQCDGWVEEDHDMYED